MIHRMVQNVVRQLREVGEFPLSYEVDKDVLGHVDEAVPGAGARHPYTISAQMNLGTCETDPIDDGLPDLDGARGRLVAIAEVVPTRW